MVIKIEPLYNFKSCS